jgi:hypothetical protein
MVAAAVLALAAAAPCAPQDARDVVARSAQAVTGRVEAVAGSRFTLAVPRRMVTGGAPGPKIDHGAD